MARTKFSAKKIAGTPIRQQLKAKLAREKVPPSDPEAGPSRSSKSKKKATPSKKKAPKRIIPYPTKAFLISKITAVTRSRYRLERNSGRCKVIQFSTSGGKERAVGYAPEYYYCGLRLLIYRLSILSSCIFHTKGRWKATFIEVLHLEFTYLATVLEKVVERLPKNPAVDFNWRCDILEEWLLITYYIKYMQSEESDYNDFFQRGESFDNQDATSLDWRAWAKSDDEKWAWVGFEDDTGHPHMKSFDIDAFIFKTQLMQKSIKQGEIPAAIKYRVKDWPKHELYWVHLHAGIDSDDGQGGDHLSDGEDGQREDGEGVGDGGADVSDEDVEGEPVGQLAGQGGNTGESCEHNDFAVDLAKKVSDSVSSGKEKMASLVIDPALEESSAAVTKRKRSPSPGKSLALNKVEAKLTVQNEAEARNLVQKKKGKEV